MQPAPGTDVAPLRRGTQRYRAHVRTVLMAGVAPVVAVAAGVAALLTSIPARAGDQSSPASMIVALQIALALTALVALVGDARLRVSGAVVLAATAVLNPLTAALVLWALGVA